MKRMLLRMAALALCLSLLAASALAADASILPKPAETDENYLIRDTETVGDAAYLLTSYKVEGQLWRWTKDMQQAELVADRLVLSNFWDSMDILRQGSENAYGKGEKDLEHAISVIFTDGEKLYGFNHLNGLVYTISETENGLAYEDVTTLPYTKPLYSSASAAQTYLDPTEVLKTGDWMVWFAADQATRNYDHRLMAFNLTTGAVKQAVLPTPYEIAPYKDGKVLALCTVDNVEREQGSYTLYTYDPRTDMTELIGMTPRGIGIRRIAYSRELDMLVYQHNTRIMGWTEEGGAEQLGFIPMSYFAKMDIVGDQMLYTTDDVSIAVSTLCKGYDADHCLNILGGNVDRLISEFHKEYADVPYYYMNLVNDETYASVMARETDSPDMVLVNAEEFNKLLEEDLLLDLSGYAEIKAYTDVLYPVYQDFVTRDGAVYGVPVGASTYDGWYINKSVMEGMGLTAEDIPTSLTELCEFATRWNNEYAEKYPYYTLLNNTGEYRERLFYAMLEGWVDYCQFAGREVTLDDPVFREMLTALDAAQLDKLNAALKQTDPEVSEYKQALIWTGVKDVGNWACYMEDFSDRIFLPITLTPETPYTAAVDSFYLWCVNAKSDNAEYAAALIAEVAQSINDMYAYVLRSDKTEPVLNKSYAASIASEREVLALLESRLADSVNPATMEKRIADQKAYIATELARQEYTVFASAIENYVNVILPGAFVRLPNDITSSDRTPELTGLFYRYIGGSLDANALITKANELMK